MSCNYYHGKCVFLNGKEGGCIACPIKRAYNKGVIDTKKDYERPTGYWKDHRWCSKCGCGIPTDVYGTSITEEEAHFCVECGAKMEA